MCVAYACKTGVPGLRQLIESEECNGDGAGLGWTTRDREGKATGVKWKKGLSAVEVHDILKEIGAYYKEGEPLPSCYPLGVHFRFASIGGKGKHLTHPFPVTMKADLSLEGEGDIPLLMHNGHWSGYTDALFWSVLGTGTKVPGGSMSDSRALALLAHRHGANILSLLPSGVGKVIFLSREGLWTFGENWIDKLEREGFLQSSSVFSRAGVKRGNVKTWGGEDIDTLTEDAYKELMGEGDPSCRIPASVVHTPAYSGGYSAHERAMDEWRAGRDGMD